MENLVIIQNEKALTTSLKVAEVFEKRHNNVVRDIDALLSGLLEFTEDERGLLKIEESSYTILRGDLL
ncbi:MAG: Rha family transcriptional regulator [Arcicella sp.]|jgi:Rha family phage regulatory protein|nr:Rha family transcriptional regulator [Microscillaceae bacterium]MCU0471178.1 Rha family transcriptional regulator [Arcicella sp.]